MQSGTHEMTVRSVDAPVASVLRARLRRAPLQAGGS
jgi:hypothetical protein